MNERGCSEWEAEAEPQENIAKAKRATEGDKQRRSVSFQRQWPRLARRRAATSAREDDVVAARQAERRPIRSRSVRLTVLIIFRLPMGEIVERSSDGRQAAKRDTERVSWNVTTARS